MDKLYSIFVDFLLAPREGKSTEVVSILNQFLLLRVQYLECLDCRILFK